MRLALILIALCLNACIAPWQRDIGHFHTVSSNREVQCLNVMPQIADAYERDQWLDWCVSRGN